MARNPTDRRGISLMEVLISMGILTIGLVSVISLIPAGRSQATKASAIDRSASLAQNAAADFINRGFMRPSGWNATPSSNIAVFDPLCDSAGDVFWTKTLGQSVIHPRIDAVTTCSSTTSITSANSATADVVMRGEDDIRYSTDNVADDSPPLARWSYSATTGRHVFDGSYSYLATLSGANTSWKPGEYKTLTIVTFNKRDTSLEPVLLTLSDTTSGIWDVVVTNIPTGQSLKDVIKPGAMVLAYTSSPTSAYSWQRVLMAADATSSVAPSSWRVGLTCEGSGVSTTSTNNKVYVFPGAIGSLQMPVKLEGTSPWND
jgi:Tfp pilus assembly protein PilV